MRLVCGYEFVFSSSRRLIVTMTGHVAEGKRVCCHMCYFRHYICESSDEKGDYIGHRTSDQYVPDTSVLDPTMTLTFDQLLCDIEKGSVSG